MSEDYKHEYKKLFPRKRKSERTGKKTLAIVGFAPTTRHMTPWDDKATIIMGLNEGYKQKFMKRWNVWMQMHSQRNFTRPDNENDPEHYAWLQEEHKFPILMQRIYPDVPKSVEYPLQDAKALVPKTLLEHNGGRYFTSSAAYMLAWGIVEGFERIEVYGFEMGSSTEYINQRACFEFWIAMATALGIEVYLPPICGILKDKLYGYERMSVGFEQRLEMMEQNLIQQAEQQKAVFNQIAGRRDQTQDMIDKKFGDLEKEAERLTGELHKSQNVVMQVEGARKQQMHILNFYRTYPFEEDEGDWTEEEANKKFGEGTGDTAE